MNLMDDKRVAHRHYGDPVHAWDFNKPTALVGMSMQDNRPLKAWDVRYGKSDVLGQSRGYGHATWDNDDDEPVQPHSLSMWLVPRLHRSASASSPENLRQRLANANDHFRRKASEVYNDQSALDLLTTFDRDVVVDISDFDTCSYGIPLSKLAAANFCEVGASVIFITDAGQRFIESLRMQGVI